MKPRPRELETTTTNSAKRAGVRRELIGTSEQLCSKDDKSRLGLTLRDFMPTLERAYILKWVPEQAEDIYWVLTGPAQIVKVEVPRGQIHDKEFAALETMDVATFQQKRHSQEVREKLAIALELVRA